MKQVLCFDWLPEWARWDCQCWSQASKKFGAANLHNLLFLLKLECSILVIVNLSNDLTFNLSNEILSHTFTVGFLSQHSKVNKSWTWVWYSSSSAIFWLYVESFIDQACLVKMAGYLPHLLFAFSMDQDVPVILTLPLVNNEYPLSFALNGCKWIWSTTLN